MYAAYLFDAVILYAKAAHHLLLEGGEITNGTAIIHSLLNQSYESMLNFNKYLFSRFCLMILHNELFFVSKYDVSLFY